MRYHVKNLINKGWVYEEREVRDVQNTTTLLARITIAKIVDEQRLVDIIRTAPVIRGDANWRCRTWVAEVLSRLAEDGAAVGSAAELNWEKIESVAREYVGRKTVEGRYERGSDQAQADVGHASRARDGVLILAGTQRCVVLA
ncbi:hypothetical protein VFPPC_13719 [Pochonia chlamydosporia 170]|uniref:Uncharacterized protein n=1 Tax=Pochonia chlamydosporia 170 TaxID=1380566 RepID=A0A179FSV1_METCM|nr:hypothetical protein VFPPC_13719 [Pochonia chlamydosporia 170]OAQ68692.1 hypothetical protein VFPPC_13719 [Pochonia chlamydosporia 170]